MPTTVGFGAHGSYAGLQKIAVWTDEGPERAKREKALGWFNRTLETSKAEKARFAKMVDRLMHRSRTATTAAEAQRCLDELEVALYSLPDGSRDADGELYHATQVAYSAEEAREERRRLRLEIDHLREFLKPGFEVKFKTASCYEAPQRVLYRAAKESEIPNFKGSYLGRFPLDSADFWTSDHLSERPRSVDAFLGTRARGTLTLKRG